MTEARVPLAGYIHRAPAEMAARAEAVLATLKTRRTIRDFSAEPVPREIIEACIKAAGTAPSGANQQPWHFVAISAPDMKRKIREAAEEEERAFYDGKAPDEWLDALAPLGTDAEKSFLETAPWLIAAFAQRRGEEGEKNYYVSESVGISVGMLITALHTAGLGTLTHTPAPMGFLNKICERPETEKPFVLMVVGYPTEGATIPKHALSKKSLDEISTFIS